MSDKIGPGSGPVASVADLNSKHSLPAQDSADNLRMADVVGNKLDTHDGNSIYSLLHTNDEHIHKEARVYPTLASGVVVTGAAGAWTLGSFVEVIPASTITDDFDLHFINVEDVSATDTYEIVFYAVTTEICRVRFSADIGVFGGALPALPTLTPLIDANTQIQAKIASAAGGSETATISLSYHTY
jgi:hypothetical protein